MRLLYDRSSVVSILENHCSHGFPILIRFISELPPKNESGSGADPEIATVVTLSDVVFEAPREDQLRLS